MIRYALTAALVACLGLGVALWWVSGQRDDARAQEVRLKRELNAAILSIEIAAQTAEIHRAHIDRMTETQAKQASMLAELEAMEGQDAPLSPLLDAAAGKLWPGR